MKSLTCFLLILSASPAFAAGKITLRNCMAPDLMTTHEITLTVARHVQRGGVPEDSIVRLRGKLLRVHMEESNPGNVKVADMLVTQPGEVVSVSRRGTPVVPLPGPETFNLPLAATQMYTKVQTLSDGPAEVPWPRSIERVVAGLLLDVAHWPRESVDVGHRWNRRIAGEEFSGEQELVLVDAATVAGEAVLIVESTVTGRFTGPAAARYSFDKCKARLMWSRGARVLMQLQGKAEYGRDHDGKKEPHALSVEVRLKKREQLPESARTAARRALTDFALAMSEYQAGHYDKAVAACAVFREKWPESVWMPALADVERRAVEAAQPAKPPTKEELTRMLTGQVLQWQTALTRQDDDLEARTHRALNELSRTNAASVRAMLTDKDDAVRALGVFVWSLGESPDHLLATLAAVRDPSARVRAWAAQGLAARADPLTDPDALRRLMSDEDATVRARACAAVARCNRHGEPIAGRLRDLLHKAVSEPNQAARLEAARAFGDVGGPADVAPLKDALSDEKDPAVREMLIRSMERIGKRGA